MEKYSINITWSQDDDCFIATVAEFPGLAAHGDTQEEALKEAQDALEGFIEIFKEDGRELPKPQSFAPYSGQIRLRLPKTLHGRLTAEAKSEGMSLNTYLVFLLSERHGDRDLERILQEIKDLHLINSCETIVSSHGSALVVTDPSPIGKAWPAEFKTAETNRVH